LPSFQHLRIVGSSCSASAVEGFNMMKVTTLGEGPIRRVSR
jgi:hypothetical protein